MGPAVPAAIMGGSSIVSAILGRKSAGPSSGSNTQYQVTDPFSQYGMGQEQREQTGQNVWDASMGGLGNLSQYASGDFSNFGGGGGGGIGGIMGMGKYGKALDADPFSDEFSQKLLNQNLSGVQSMRDRSLFNVDDIARQAGIDREDPMYYRLQQRSGRGVDEFEAQNRQSTFLSQAMEKLNNQRMQAQMETSLRGISRQAQGMERAASTGANASMYNSRLGLAGRAASILGSGEAFQNFGRPYGIDQSSQQKTSSPGWLSSLASAGGSIGDLIGQQGSKGGGGDTPFTGPGGSLPLGGNKVGM